MPRHPAVYAGMLGERLDAHGVPVWLVNTGWTGGPYGVGRRMDIQHTRDLVHAALNGRLEGVDTRLDPIFGLRVPVAVPGVPAEVLWPRDTWPDPEAFDRQARLLARMFADNFRQFDDGVSEAIRAAGPRVA
jgi:phosphoenolpyruvate carboxykinase (ATP)